MWGFPWEAPTPSTDHLSEIRTWDFLDTRRKGSNHYTASMFPPAIRHCRAVTPKRGNESLWNTCEKHSRTGRTEWLTQILKICRMINVNSETTKRHLPLLFLCFLCATTQCCRCMKRDVCPAYVIQIYLFSAHLTTSSFAKTTQRRVKLCPTKKNTQAWKLG
jgi:hypothetical protein